MALTITSNFSAVADSTLTMLNKHQSVMGKTIEKVSSGMKINHSKDNSVQFARAQKLTSDADGMGTVTQNLQSNSSYLSAVDSAVTSIIDTLNQIREKALEWGSGNVKSGSEEETNLKSAISYLQKDLSTIVDKTKYNGKEVLKDALNADETFNLINDPFAFNDDLEVKIDSLADLATAYGTTINDSATALSEITGNDGKIYKALSKMRDVQADVGLGMQRIENTVSFLQDYRSVTEDAVSIIKDADMAKEMTTYVKQNVLAQASQAMLAQANSGYASVLNLLSA